MCLIILKFTQTPIAHRIVRRAAKWGVLPRGGGAGTTNMNANCILKNNVDEDLFSESMQLTMVLAALLVVGPGESRNVRGSRAIRPGAAMNVSRRVLKLQPVRSHD